MSANTGRGVAVVVFAAALLGAGPGQAQEPTPVEPLVTEVVSPEVADLGQARLLYQRGDLEEALTLLQALAASGQDPVEVNYLLGAVYQEMVDLTRAEAHFAQVLSQAPEHGDAHSHLGEIYFTQGRFAEAEQALDKAQRYQGRLAYTSYLAGQVDLQAERYPAAVAAFARAAELDPELKQKAEYSQGLAWYRNNQPELAEAAFLRAIGEDPESDAGMYARISLEQMRREQAQQGSPFHARLRYAYSYDDNVVLNPSQSLVPLTISDQSDYRHTLVADASYAAELSEQWKLNSAYQFSHSAHNALNEFNVTGHALSVTPTRRLEQGELGLQLSADHYTLDSADYLRIVGTYLSYQHAYSKARLGTFRFGYRRYDYLQTTTADENRDGPGLLLEYGHLEQLASGDGYFSLALGLARDDADGQNWDNDQLKLEASFAHRLGESMTGELYGGYLRQDFSNTHSSYGIKRADDIVSIAAAVTYALDKAWRLAGQYSRTEASSNIGVYSYQRAIYSLSVEYAF